MGGFGAPNWGWNNANGLAAIWAGLVIAPALAAAFAAIVYLLVKFIVLKNKNPTRMGLYTGPFWFFLVAAVCTMSIIYKGSPTLNLKSMSKGKTAASILLTGLVIALLACLFWIPYVHAKVIKKDHTIRFYHFFMGPLLFRRPAPADAGSVAYVPDYRIRETREHDVVGESLETYANSPAKAEQAREAAATTLKPKPTSSVADSNEKIEPAASLDQEPVVATHASPLETQVEMRPKSAWTFFRYTIIGNIVKVLTHGSSVDIHKLQAGEAHTAQGQRMQGIYNRAVQYPNETEHLFSFLQVMTACTASFAHGANDLSNAIGPFSVIYYTWKTGNLANKSVPVEVWYLVYGAATLVIGLWTYGYNIMAVLGNRITLHSPSRGFTMELGAAITVILASQYGIPVSTTMCITGATIGTSLCNGDLKSTNWRAIAWIYAGWIGTIVVVMILSGVSLGIIVNAPQRA